MLIICKDDTSTKCLINFELKNGNILQIIKLEKSIGTAYLEIEKSYMRKKGLKYKKIRTLKLSKSTGCFSDFSQLIFNSKLF